MPIKPQKKPVVKRKQNGKKITKGQMSRSKQKYEMETSPKEQITELDKEIFSVKINDYESKLNRKKHLCSYMEEEICIYKTMYNEKQLLKKESMKLLNKAFEDFSTEIFLLDQELNAMQYAYSEIMQRQMFCSVYKERVQKLSVIEAKLGEDLLEAEKCVEELPELSEKLAELQEKEAKGMERFICAKQSILKEFETCLLSIQNEINSCISNAIGDKKLKLDLLPAPYKKLFVKGFLSSSWLDSALQFHKFLQIQNTELASRYSDLMSALTGGRERVRMFFSGKNVIFLFQVKQDSLLSSKEIQFSKPKKFEASIVLRSHENPQKYLQHLEKLSLSQQIKVKSMKSEIKDIEASIKLLEMAGETTFEKSYLIQIICKAGSLMKQEL